MFFLKQGKRLSNLKGFTHKIEHFVQGLDMLSTGRLSQTPIHPRRVLTLLRKVVHDVTMKNSQFIPLYTELYHYYETHSVSFTNTEDYLIIQIPIFFVNNKQALMDLYKLHTVHVPLDKDTYNGKESKYMRLDLKQNHLAISKEVIGTVYRNSSSSTNNNYCLSRSSPEDPVNPKFRSAHVLHGPMRA